MSYSDFNNDGFDDLAIGVRGETIGDGRRAGSVNVLYGTAGGPSAAGDQSWSQNSSGIAGTADTFDFFGGAVGSGDFDGDGFDDLAVGARGEIVGDTARAGAVNVLYGSAAGLTASGSQFWHQNSTDIKETADAFDFFGGGLTIGDFNNDGFDDMAVGVSDEDIGSVIGAGAVNAIYGSAAGLTAEGNQLWHQNSDGVENGNEREDFFGRTLASGDFDGDGFDDLALGVTGEDLGSISNAGAVNVLFGSAAGLSATGDQFWTQNAPGVEGGAEKDDSFGEALAVGDFDGDGFDDLAIGVRGEDIGSARDAGSVNVLHGSANGLTAANDQSWTQNTRGIEGGAETEDFFGESLAAGDFDGDGFDDLAIAAPGEDIGSAKNTGAVHVLYGSGAGLTGGRDQLWHQNKAGVAGGNETDDYFGHALTIGDFNDDGFDDLAIGSREAVGEIKDAGAVNVLFGSANGLTAAGDQVWTQNSPGVLGGSEANDLFGLALA